LISQSRGLGDVYKRQLPRRVSSSSLPRRARAAASTKYKLKM
jgi:hypothetical protein